MTSGPPCCVCLHYRVSKWLTLPWLRRCWFWGIVHAMTIAMAGLLNQTSPVLTAGMGQESLADRLARLAAEARDRADYAKGDPMATNPDAPQEGPALSAYPAVLQRGGRNSTGGLAEAVAPRQSTGNGSFRGITSGMAPEVPEIQQLEQDITGAARAAAEGTVPGQQGPATTPEAPMPPAQAGYALIQGKGNELADGVSIGRKLNASMQEAAASNGVQGYEVQRPAGADPANDLVKPPSNLAVSPPANPMELAKLSQGLRPEQAQAAQPPMSTPPPQRPLNAREQAEVEVGPRTKMNKLGIALSAAAETLGGLAGGMNSGATARAMGARGAKIAARTKEIQAEMDRLQADLDKEQARARLDKQDARADKVAEANIKNETMQAETGRMNAETARVNATNNADDKRRDDEFRAKKLADKNTEKKLRALPPGGILYEYDPTTGRSVAIAQNHNEVVTSTDTSNTQTFTDPATGRTYTKRDDTTTTQRKGTAPAGAAPKGASAGVTDSDRQSMGTIQSKIMAGIPLTKAEAAAGARLEASGVVFQTPKK